MAHRWSWACIFAACYAAAQTTPAPDPLAAVTSADVAAGKRVFNSQCALCHGAGGTGGRGPLLTSAKFRRAADNVQLMDVITDGINGTGMPAFWFLGERPIFQVTAYVRSLSAHATTATLPGNIERGRVLYQENGCAGCHSIGGRGAAYGPDLSDIGTMRSADFLRRAILDPATSVQDGFAFVRVNPHNGASMSGVRVNEDTFTIQLRDASGAFHSYRKQDLASLQKDFTKSPMPSYRAKLSDTDMDDLVAWLANLKESNAK